MKQLLHGRNAGKRFVINGYREEGTTTTPFDMLVRNGVSRFQVVTQAIQLAAKQNSRVAARATERVHAYEYRLRHFVTEIAETGRDPDELAHWQWKRAA